MKCLLPLLYFICVAITGYSQGINEYVVVNIPVSQTNTTADIATYIKNNFNSESEKVRAIYSWITLNMRYDKDSPHLAILTVDRGRKIAAALKRRKGVCEHFAAIFNDICIKSGIKSFVIEGYTKQSGSVDKSPHAWCAALVDYKWFLYDPTWDGGFTGSIRN
ncbi:MAG: transglutaminase-like domain-containing protein, partial [Ginsengibacter sp.]